jgi:hypothetical protein
VSDHAPAPAAAAGCLSSLKKLLQEGFPFLESHSLTRLNDVLSHTAAPAAAAAAVAAAASAASAAAVVSMSSSAAVVWLHRASVTAGSLL